MKKTLLAVAALSILSGCASNSDNERLQELELNQRVLAARLGMTNVTMPSTIEYMDGIQIGNPKAPFVVIEFTDLQCPYCAKFQTETFPKFKEKYIDTGEVLYVAKELPLKQIHAEATNAAIALRCANEQNATVYSEFKNELFTNAKSLNGDFYTKTAENYQLDMVKFDQCTNSKEQRKIVNTSYKYAMGLGLASTPSFIFGENQDNAAHNYLIAKGALSLDNLDEAIQQLKDKK